MRRMVKSFAFIALPAWLLACGAAQAGIVELDFESPKFGTVNENCVNNPRPPLFNRPEYGSQTAAYIVDPAACAEGAFGGTFGSSSYLQGGPNAFFSPNTSHGDSSSNELRFSWVDPTDDNTWARLITSTAQSVAPRLTSPTIDIRPGSRIAMDINVFGQLADNTTENPAGQLEFSLVVRETNKNLPLGVDGGTAGPLEFVGVDCIGPTPGCAGGGSTDALAPSGGAVLTHNSDVPLGNFNATFYTVEWEFVDDGGVTKVDVSINGGAPVRKSIAGWTGDGILSTATHRATLDSLAIRKPVNDDSTKKWFVYVDHIVIEAPGVTDPVQLLGPISALHTSVTVTNINTDDTTAPPPDGAESVHLYINGADAPGSPVSPPYSGGNSHAFTGLTLNTGDILTATQVVGGIESDPSAPITVTDRVCIDDFEGGVTGGASLNPPPPPAVGDFRTWYNVNGQSFATSGAGTLDGSGCLTSDDGGFMNGVYAIYDNVIPADGTYRVSARMHVTEDGAQLNSIRQYEMGIVVNGVHRDMSSSSPGTCANNCHNTSLLAVDSSLPGNAVASYVGLTSADNSGMPTQEILTGEFTANEGDNVLIVFSTNVQTKWGDVTPAANGSLDGLDGCQSCGGFPPTCVGCANGQGTWNILANGNNTSATWNPGGVVRIDDICLVKSNPCASIAAVSVGTPLVHGQTQVTVNGIDPNATVVKVYANGGGAAIGTAAGSPPNTPASIVVTTSALVGTPTPQTISATQTIGGQEGCVPTVGIVVGDCSQIAGVAVTGPVNAGDTSVTVTDVAAAPIAVKVYDISTDPDTLLATKSSGFAGTGTEVLTIPGAIKGHSIAATQTLPASQAAAGNLEGCVPTSGQVVGSGGNAGLRLSLGIRENSTLTGPVGADGGATSPTGEGIEWIIPNDPNDPDDGVENPNGIPRGKKIMPSPVWQTITFDPVNDPKGSFTGDGILTGTFGVLEHVAIVIDEDAPDVGPYTMYIDNVANNGVVFEDFENPDYVSQADEQVIFRQPTFSGSSGPNLSVPPNISVVDPAKGDASTTSERLEWRFIDEGLNRWIRLTTLGPASATFNRPNPMVNLTQPITIRVLLLPAITCNTPAVDFNGDEDVDMYDFQVFQACFDPTQILPGCECADVNNSGTVDLSDFGDPSFPVPPTFVGCASQDRLKSDCAP